MGVGVCVCLCVRVCVPVIDRYKYQFTVRELIIDFGVLQSHTRSCLLVCIQFIFVLFLSRTSLCYSGVIKKSSIKSDRLKELIEIHAYAQYKVTCIHAFTSNGCIDHG